MKANCYHLIGGFTAALLSVLSLAYGWPPLVSIIVIAVANLYTFLFFIECGLRSSDRSRPYPKPKKLFELPDRVWAPLQLFFLSFVFIPGFANLYIHTGSVEHWVSDKSEPSSEIATNETNTPIQVEYLSDKLDAFYFSFVTITTLGYGDYVPANRMARYVVVWELVATLQLILFAFPLVVSRLGDY